MSSSDRSEQRSSKEKEIKHILFNATYFPLANVKAPGHRFDRTTATEYSGNDLDETYVVQAGNPDTAVKRM